MPRVAWLDRLRPEGWRAATLVTSGLTLAGMLSGLVRDMLLARWFGAGAIIDAFLVALIVPTLLENLFGLALRDALVPIFSSIRARQGEGPLLEVFNGFGLGLTFGTVVAALVFYWGAAQLVGVVAPGLPSATAELAVRGLRLASFAIVLTAWLHLLGSLLQIQRFFPVLAARSLPYNLGIILGGGFLAASQQPEGLLAGLLVGTVAQLALQWIVLRLDGWSVGRVGRVPKGFYGQFVSALGPIMIVTMALQINVMGERYLASNLSAGAIAVLYYAYRMIMLPVNLVAEPLATTTFAGLAAYQAQGHTAHAANLAERASRWVLFVMVPATAGIIILREPLVRLLFQGGAFQANDVERTAAALAAYAVGLIGFAGAPVVLRALYASRQARWAALIGVLASSLYLILASTWVKVWAETGLALAMGVAGLANFLLLAVVYARTTNRQLQPSASGWLSFVGRLGAATGALSGLLLALQAWLGVPQALGPAALLVALESLLAAAGFLGVALALRLPEADTVFGLARERLRRLTVRPPSSTG